MFEFFSLIFPNPKLSVGSGQSRHRASWWLLSENWGLDHTPLCRNCVFSASVCIPDILDIKISSFCISTQISIFKLDMYIILSQRFKLDQKLTTYCLLFQNCWCWIEIICHIDFNRFWLVLFLWIVQF